MKKIFAILLAVLCAAFALAGCNNGGSGESSAEESSAVESSAESPAEAGGKFYAVISARYEGNNWECDDFFAHVGKMPDALRSPQKRQLAGQYLKFLQNKLRVILRGMSQSASGDPAAEQYQEIYLQLDELLEREGLL